MVSILDRVRGRSNPPALPVEEPEEIFEEMTLQEHLEELRKRIMYAGIFVVIGVVIGMIIAFDVLQVMASATGRNEFLIISPLEGFGTYMKVALYIGLAIAMPALVYQLVRFLAPGLTRKERHYLYRALPFVSLMFVAGVAFAFFVVVPNGLRFLGSFGDGVFNADFRAQEVVSFYMTLLLWVGVTFEMPVVIFILAKLGVVTPEKLSKARKFMVVGVMIAAAAITPSPDPFNMMLVALPMYGLYEFGVLLARIA